MPIWESFWIRGFIPVQFLLVLLFAFLVFVAAKPILRRFNMHITAFWQALLVWFTGYAIFKFVVVPPLPSHMFYQYMGVIAAATFLWVSATDDSWNECKHTVLSLLGGRTPGWRVARALLFTSAPVLVAMNLHDSLTPKFPEPVELRTWGGAPPNSILVDDAWFTLSEERNPFRVDELGRYSDTVQSQRSDADPWNSNAIPYLRYVREGGVLYFQECHYCRGAALDGRGIFSNTMMPLPGNFSDSGLIAQRQESYLFWQIYAGGIGMPIETFPWAQTMPAYREVLSPHDAWKVILFLYWATGYEPRTWN
ncbi:MAG: hypothetical protein AB1451_04525 [Nitrospirota bacterium]